MNPKFVKLEPLKNGFGTLITLTIEGVFAKSFALGIVGGISSELAGGSFADGFKFSFGITLLGETARAMRDQQIIESAKNPNNLTRGPNVAGDSFSLGGERAINPSCEFTPTLCGYLSTQPGGPMGGLQGK